MTRKAEVVRAFPEKKYFNVNSNI